MIQSLFEAIVWKLLSPPHPQYLLQIGAPSCRSLTVLYVRVCVWIWGHVYCVNARGQTLKSCCPRGVLAHITRVLTGKHSRTEPAGSRSVAALVIKFLAQRSAALKHRRGAESLTGNSCLSRQHHMLSFQSFGPICISTIEWLLY